MSGELHPSAQVSPLTTVREPLAIELNGACAPNLFTNDTAPVLFRGGVVGFRYFG